MLISSYKYYKRAVLVMSVCLVMYETQWFVKTLSQAQAIACLLLSCEIVKIRIEFYSAVQLTKALQTNTT